MLDIQLCAALLHVLVAGSSGDSIVKVSFGDCPPDFHWNRDQHIQVVRTVAFVTAQESCCWEEVEMLSPHLVSPNLDMVSSSLVSLVYLSFNFDKAHPRITAYLPSIAVHRIA